MPRKRNSTQRSILRSLTGHSIKVQPAPKTVVVAPWYPLTAVVKVDNTQTWTVNGVFNNLRDQHGLRADGTDSHRVPGFIRFHSIRAWSLSSKGLSSISLEVFDPTFPQTKTAQVLFRESRTSAKNQWASMGYVFPSRVYECPMDDAETATLFEIAVTASSLIQVNCLFRGSAVQQLPFLTDLDTTGQGFEFVPH